MSRGTSIRGVSWSGAATPPAVQQAEAGGFLRSVSKRLLGGVASGSVAPMAAPGPASGLLEDRPSPGHALASRTAGSAGPSRRASLSCAPEVRP
jgi:hypothetical protein